MFGKTVFLLWPLLSYTEIPGYLTQMEEKGLQFRRLHLYGLIGEFRKAPPVKRCYAWDYWNPKEQGADVTEALLQYLEFCEEAGWEVAWQFENDKIFREKTVGNSIPFHSDEEILREKRKIAAKKNALVAFPVMLFLATIWGLLIWPDIWTKFPVMTLRWECAAVALTGWLWGETLWCLWGGLEPYLKRNGLPAVTEGKAVFRTILQAAGLICLVLVLLEPTVLGEGWAGMAGAAIGAPIGSAIGRRRAGMGMKAKEKGMKGIPSFGWKSLFAAILPPVVFIAILLFPIYGSGQNRPVEGSSLYCNRLYRESGTLEWSSGYYMARSSEDAERIVKFYLQDWRRGMYLPWKWSGEADALPEELAEFSQLTGGCPSPPVRAGSSEQVKIFLYGFSEHPSEGARATAALVRRDREVWLLVDDD